MAWTPLPMATGETLDPLTEEVSVFDATATLITTSASFVNTGAAANRLPYSVAGADCRLSLHNNKKVADLLPNIIGGGRVAGIFVVGFAIRVSALLSSPAALLQNDFQAGTAAHHHYLDLDTSFGFSFYDASGLQVGPTSDPLPQMLAKPQHIHAVWDVRTSDPSTTIIRLFYGQEEVLAFDAGASFSLDNNDYLQMGEWQPAGIARMPAGFIAIDDAMIRYSSTGLASDSPHVTAYPMLRGVGGMYFAPAKEGNYVEWAPTGAGIPNTFQNVDDAPNTGDTDYIQTTDSDPLPPRRHLFRWNTANPFAGTETIDYVQQKMLMKVLAGGKLSQYPLMRLSGTDLQSPDLVYGPTAYAGVAYVNLARPGGGSWGVADFDLAGDGFSKLEFGAISVTFAGFNTGPRITLLPGPEVIYHTQMLNIAAPTGEVERPRTVRAGLGKVLRPRYDHVHEPRGLRRLRDLGDRTQQTSRNHRRQGARA